MIPSSPEGHYAILLAKNGVRHRESQAFDHRAVSLVTERLAARSRMVASDGGSL